MINNYVNTLKKLYFSRYIDKLGLLKKSNWARNHNSNKHPQMTQSIHSKLREALGTVAKTRVVNLITKQYKNRNYK